MKHLKYIKEYFDSEELSAKHGDIDFKKMVQDDSIIKNSILDVVTSFIRKEVTYFKNWDVSEFEGGLSFMKGYDWFIDKGESVFAKLSMHIEIDEQNIIEKDSRLENYFFTVTYASVIVLIEPGKTDDEYTRLFEDEYEGISNVGGGDVKIKFKNNFGATELINFLKKEMVPQMEKTVDEFEKLTREKIGRRDDVNPSPKLN